MFLGEVRFYEIYVPRIIGLSDFMNGEMLLYLSLWYYILQYFNIF